MSGHDPGELDALRELLAEWAERHPRVIVLGEDRGLDHGRLCWDALRPTGLLHPHCTHCRNHGGPRDDRQLHERLKVRIPVGDAAIWLSKTLWRVPGLGGAADPRDADVLAGPLADLLGPDADWRANGYAAHRPPGGTVGWSPVTECTFDAAVVGIGNGYTLVAVATGED